MANKRTFALLFLAAITSINPYLGPAFAEESQWNGFVNYTRWVDKNNDNNVVEDELLNFNEFVLNDLGNFSFMAFQPRSNKFFVPEEEKLKKQYFEIYAKDNDSGKEWKVYESTFGPGNINLLQLLPIAGNITLTCTYSNFAKKPSLTYEFISKNKEEDQHLNYYLNDEQILALSKLSEEKVNAFRSAKSVGLKIIQNYDWATAYELPFYETANRLLKFTGININDDQNTTNDLQIIVNVSGTSEPGSSSIRVDGHDRKVDTRVSVGLNGTIIFKSARKDFYANNFNWKRRVYPLDFVVKGGRWSQKSDRIFGGYRSMFYDESFLKYFGDMLIGAFELDPVDFYLYAATDESEAISYNALRLLGELHDKTAFGPLVEIYSNDKSIWKRRGAIYALGEMQDPRAFDILIEALNEEDSKIRSNAGETLFNTLLEMQDPRAFDIMSEALSATYSDLIRGLAAIALGDLDDSRTTGVLINALEDKKHIVVIDVVNALGKSRDKHIMEPLIININRAEKNKDWRKWQRNAVIKATIKVLGGFRDPVTIEHIIPLMKKRAFREEAQKALINLTGEDLGKKYKDWINWWNENKEGYK